MSRLYAVSVIVQYRTHLIHFATAIIAETSADALQKATDYAKQQYNNPDIILFYDARECEVPETWYVLR